MALSVKRSGLTKRKRSNHSWQCSLGSSLSLSFFKCPQHFLTVSPPLPLYLDSPWVDNQGISCYMKSVNTVSFVTPRFPFLISVCIFSKGPCLSWFFRNLLFFSSYFSSVYPFLFPLYPLFSLSHSIELSSLFKDPCSLSPAIICFENNRTFTIMLFRILDCV